jgi:predicted nucleic acid-binding protein
VRVYCDTSALLKRSLAEPDSDKLERHLQLRIERGDFLASSALTWVEVNRAIRASRDDLDPATWIEFERLALSGVYELPLDAATLSLARRVGSPRLRSLDAIHLAAAIQGNSDVIVTYDQRLAAVAEEMGIEAVSPF